MTPRYLKTSEMARYIGRSTYWLKKMRSDGAFLEGRHYFQPVSGGDPFWSVEAMERWIRGSEEKELAESVVADMLS